MIPRERPVGTDARPIRCDVCRRRVMVHPSDTIEELRDTAARSGWGARGKIDTCPDCTRRARGDVVSGGIEGVPGRSHTVACSTREIDGQRFTKNLAESVEHGARERDNDVSREGDTPPPSTREETAMTANTNTKSTPESGSLVTPMSAKQREAIEALARYGTQPTAVNTVQALIRRGLVEVLPDGDAIALTPDGEVFARGYGWTDAEPIIETDRPEVVEPDEAPQVEAARGNTTGTDPHQPVAEDKPKASRKSSKTDEPTVPTIRIPEQFRAYLQGVKPSKAVTSLLARCDKAEVASDHSVRIEVKRDDLDVLRKHAVAMADTATDGVTKRVANGRVRWIDRMIEGWKA